MSTKAVSEPASQEKQPATDLLGEWNQMYVEFLQNLWNENHLKGKNNDDYLWKMVLSTLINISSLKNGKVDFFSFIFR